MDTSTLKRFKEFLTGLGTQPVTVPVEEIVDGMLESYAGACSEAGELCGFRWASEPEKVRETLERFVRTRECFFQLEGHLPAIEATFLPAARQAGEELEVEIRFKWFPPLMGFENLRNVYHEDRSFSLKPTLDADGHVEFETELGHHLPWNECERRFEGHWPPIIASIAGAQRLEAFTMPLQMNAHVIETFPGDMFFERTIRLAIPITIKRKPETCSGGHELPTSPGVTRPAYSYPTVSPAKFSSTHTTPQAVMHCSGNITKSPYSSPSYKELGDLMKRKARAGGPTSPLRLNSLSLAQL